MMDFKVQMLDLGFKIEKQNSEVRVQEPLYHRREQPTSRPRYVTVRLEGDRALNHIGKPMVEAGNTASSSALPADLGRQGSGLLEDDVQRIQAVIQHNQGSGPRAYGSLGVKLQIPGEHPESYSTALELSESMVLDYRKYRAYVVITMMDDMVVATSKLEAL